MYLFAGCGDGTYVDLAELGYGKGLRLAKGRKAGWRNLWLVTGEKDPDDRRCYVEIQYLFRFDRTKGTYTYINTHKTRITRTCGSD